MDVFTKEKRSSVMSKIKSKDTEIELMVRRYLFSKGFRYRKNYKKLVGKPDIVLPKYKTVVFIHGCFWHGHKGCKYFVMPKSRTEFWAKKINGNIKRDEKVVQALKDAGWNVVVVWECELSPKCRDERLKLLTDQIKDNIK